jgi:hypothetical protein
LIWDRYVCIAAILRMIAAKFPYAKISVPATQQVMDTRHV